MNVRNLNAEIRQVQIIWMCTAKRIKLLPELARMILNYLPSTRNDYWLHVNDRNVEIKLDNSYCANCWDYNHDSVDSDEEENIYDNRLCERCIKLALQGINTRIEFDGDLEMLCGCNDEYPYGYRCKLHCKKIV